MKRNTSGFTLVELLVVITIIGILAGLLLPAVNAARETARRSQCSTQIRNLALAAVQYENQKGEFPGWIQEYGRYTVPAGGLQDPADPNSAGAGYANHLKVGTWAVSLLPYLDAQPVYERWTEDRYPIVGAPAGSDISKETSGPSGDGYNSNSCPNLAIMQCPSSPTIQGEYGRNSYIANNGFHHLDDSGSAVTVRGAATPATFRSSMDKANGIFVNKFSGEAGSALVVATGEKVTIDDIKDGQGNTALFSENLQALPWHRAGFMNRAAMEAGNVAYDLGSRFTNGMVWHYEDPDNIAGSGNVLEFHKINGGNGAQDRYNLQISNQTEAQRYARPSSAHNGGVNVGFADGAVRFVADTVDYRVYQALLTPRGKSSDVPFNEYVLQGESL